MFCPRCGAENAVDDSFCAKCGTPLPPQAVAPPPGSPQPQPLSATVPPWGGGLPAHGPAGPPWIHPYYPQPPNSGQALIPPTAATVLAIVGGVIIAIAGVLELLVGSAISQLAVGFDGGTLILSGLLGVVAGVLVLVFGAVAYVQPQHHVVFGVLIVVFSVISLVSFAGGFFLGFVLGLVAGILAIVHRPSPLFPGIPYAMPPVFQRVCPKCGRVIDPSVRFCPHCGNALT